uniref:Phosphoglycerate mutase n=2 Tax=Pseudo-nitzschia australis TaxID=44445 RepID=A0A7S4EM12_9STRA|mmetsp:Transcript_7188/g.15349  ORF Transcript_7188/g.15349 Transcript_7188/m.15349 type:complete len:371 (+) Transcript_7188:89-1201(+)
MMIRGNKKAVTIHHIVQQYHRGRGRASPTITYGFRRASSTIGKCGSTKTPPPSTVVLLRHGQSLWNKIPTFSGWCDVPLTDLGIEQARCAARVMKKKGFNFDAVYVSQLRRAYESGEAVLEVMGNTAKASSKPVKPVKAWELNERHYGELQGFSKVNPELVSIYGEEQMRAWRREMKERPPPMNEAHPYYQPPPAPLTESLYDCQKRVLRYWHGTIVPEMLPQERTILIAAHANTIRSLIAYLDEVPDEEVPHIHIPNSVPCIYKIDSTTGKAIEQDFSPLSKSKGNWLLSAENQERLVENLGVDSESFARSAFAAWDVDEDGLLSKEELMTGLFKWKRDPNPAINVEQGGGSRRYDYSRTVSIFGDCRE